MIVLIDQQEYQSEILNNITSGKFKEITKNMQNGEEPLFKDGFIQGMAYASILTSQIKHYYANINEENSNDSNSEAGVGTENSSSET